MEYVAKNWLGIVFLCMGCFGISLGVANARRVADSASWPTVKGEITKSTIVTKQRRRRSKKTQPTVRYLPEIEFAYVVGDSRYMHKQIYFSDQSPAQIVKKYTKGSTVNVTYNPRDVNDSFLEPPAASNSYVLYGMGAFFIVLGTGFLILPAVIGSPRKKPGLPTREQVPSSSACAKPEIPNGAAGSRRRRPVTIGDISALIGRDVRELKLDGWSDQQIQELIDQKLAEQS